MFLVCLGCLLLLPAVGDLPCHRHGGLPSRYQVSSDCTFVADFKIRDAPKTDLAGNPTLRFRDSDTGIRIICVM